MPAQHEEIEAAEREGIVIRTGVVVDEVLGNGRTGSVRCQLQQPTGRVEGGRAVWEAVPGSQVEISCATILVAIGEEPDPSILPPGAGIEVSSWAGIMADPRTLATGRAGVFAGGDVVSGPKTVIDAVANGRRAAASIHEYLSGARDGEAEIFAAVRYRTAPDRQLTLALESRERAHVDHPEYVPGSFTANEPGLDEISAQAEASRCFRCDAVYSCGVVQVVSGRGPRDDRSAPTPVHQAPGAFPVAAGTSGGTQR